VLGTLVLAALAGHRRYAHVAALRGDAVAAQVAAVLSGRSASSCYDARAQAAGRVH
jgi:hypothetical protein